ncbi:MAG: hypothetical protein D6776_05750 [Planctomycetota bacterium]|nr:MAG: hypothetical protein D6776_05750 [Planctomycetota bacterium]
MKKADAGRDVTPEVALVPKLACPHCWHRFPPEQTRWVARHEALRDDPVLGPDAFLRFLPSRFDVHGDALDPYDMPCTELACPRCHLEIPRLCLEARPVFLSLIGTPGSGKSNFLAAMTWRLRELLGRRFRLQFRDADPRCNAILNEYERKLFLQDRDETQVVLEKTELHGQLYRPVHMDEQTVELPRPFVFQLRPAPDHPVVRERGETSGYALCLYDNAGEHFLPGEDRVDAPGTQHLGVSELLLFLFDPTQDPRFRRRCREVSDDPQLALEPPAARQDVVLHEAGARIRRYGHLPSHAPIEQPLLVIVSKADIWAPLLGLRLDEPPYLPPSSPEAPWAIDETRVREVSARTRALLVELCPELVDAAEGLSRRVRYVPVSALGRSPVRDAARGLVVPAGEIRPRWVTVPIVYAISRWMLPGLIRRARRQPVAGAERSRAAAEMADAPEAAATESAAPAGSAQEPAAEAAAVSEPAVRAVSPEAPEAPAPAVAATKTHDAGNGAGPPQGATGAETNRTSRTGTDGTEFEAGAADAADERDPEAAATTTKPAGLDNPIGPEAPASSVAAAKTHNEGDGPQAAVGRAVQQQGSAAGAGATGGTTSPLAVEGVVRDHGA